MRLHLLLTVLLWPALAYSQVAEGPSDSAPKESPARVVASGVTLIEVSRDRVNPGEEFKARITNDLPYKVEPKPRFMTTRLEEAGHRILEITAGEESITIIVDHHVIHPTVEELEAAPAFETKAAWIEWNQQRGEDEHYSDSRTVMVGDGPGPEPVPPGPDPPVPPDDLTAKVKQWLSAVNSPKKTEETKSLGELYLTLASKVAAGGITDEDALAEEMTNGHVDKLGVNARLWFGFIQSLGTTINAAPDVKAKGKVFESVGNALKAL